MSSYTGMVVCGLNCEEIACSLVKVSNFVNKPYKETWDLFVGDYIKNYFSWEIISKALSRNMASKLNSLATVNGVSLEEAWKEYVTDREKREFVRDEIINLIK